VDGYLLETSALSALLDPQHEKHAIVKSTVAALPSDAPVYVSSVALAELTFGVRLYEAYKGALEKADSVLAAANGYPMVDVTRHTSIEYAELKKNVAVTYLTTPLSKDDRKRWIENWVDKTTGQVLQIDENDLWQCAQARERNLVLVTIDGRIERIEKADSNLRLLVIKQVSEIP
jgi:predicted nucleic acid-binding protein